MKDLVAKGFESSRSAKDVSFHMSFHFTNVFSWGVCEMNEKKKQPGWRAQGAPVLPQRTTFAPTENPHVVVPLDHLRSRRRAARRRHWYFGRPIHPNPAPEEKRVASTTPAQAEPPKELPPKVIEVIDLTQAYEPVREPEPVALGQVDPASFIEEQWAAKRIPYAIDEDNPYRDLLIQIRNTRTGVFSAWRALPGTD